MKDIYDIMKIGKKIKKPVQSFGGIHENGAYLWIKIPMKNDNKPIGNI